MNKKGEFEFGDIFKIAMFVLLMVVFAYLFNPLMDILGVATENMTHGTLTMVLMSLLPVVVVGFFIWSMANKTQQPRY
jgi:predicted PurR-regulated permease PerM